MPNETASSRLKTTAEPCVRLWLMNGEWCRGNATGRGWGSVRGGGFGGLAG